MCQTDSKMILRFPDVITKLPKGEKQEEEKNYTREKVGQVMTQIFDCFQFENQGDISDVRDISSLEIRKKIKDEHVIWHLVNMQR